MSIIINYGGNGGSGSSGNINVFDYKENYAPTANINPSETGVTWLDTSKGRLYVCIDNTPDNNIWVSNGVYFPVYPEGSGDPLTADFFGDASIVAFYPYDSNFNSTFGAGSVNTTYGSPSLVTSPRRVGSKALNINGTKYIHYNGLGNTGINSITLWVYKSGDYSSGHRYIMDTRTTGSNTDIIIVFDDTQWILHNTSRFVINALYENEYHYLPKNEWLFIYLEMNATAHIPGLWRLGAYEGSNSEFFRGYIDNLRFFNRTLSDEEITQLYQAEKNG